MRSYCMFEESLWNPRWVTWNRKPGISSHTGASSKWVWHQFRVNSSSFHAHLCNQALMIYGCCRHTVCLGRLIKVSAEPLSLVASQLVEWYVQISHLAGLLWSFNFLFRCPTFLSVSHLHKTWESAPPRTCPPTNTHADSAASTSCKVPLLPLSTDAEDNILLYHTLSTF